MTRRLLVAGLLLLPASAAAQLARADSAFARGEYPLARQLYDSVLRRDSLDPRALYQLAVLDSWDGKLDRSLARLATLRRVRPNDPDVMVEHAKVLSWARRFRWSAALYDSVLARAPDRLDALVGRARSVSWDGDLVTAERLWRDALKRHPDDPDILIGLAQTLSWKGETFMAEGFATRAREQAPNDVTARELLARLRANRGPVLSLGSDGADDIYRNRFVTFTGAFSASPRPDLRGTLSVTLRRNSDGVAGLGPPIARSYGADLSLVKSLRSGAALRAGLGARRLDGDTGVDRTRPTAQLGGVFRLSETASLDVAYRHAPFDETAALVTRGFMWDELAANAEFTPRPNLGFSGSANAAWLTDGNRRLIGAAGVMVGVARRLRAGVYLRAMGWSHKTLGQGVYFSPGRFLLGEGRASYVWWHGGWWLRATAGLGAQRVDSEATQGEWHGDFTVAYNWRYVDEVALVAAYTNSAEASTAVSRIPTYRYWSIGLRYQRGF